MSLPRKDVRLKLPAALHGALAVLAEADGYGHNLAEYAERLLDELVSERVHKANLIAEGARRLGFDGKVGEGQGKP